MAGNRNRHHNKRPKARGPASAAATRTPLEPPERKAPVVYGKPFVVLEDTEKKTFVFRSGKWIEHTATIAQSRLDCQVKELPQKINGMTRYEICAPV